MNCISGWLIFILVILQMSCTVQGCGPVVGPGPATESKGYPDCNFTTGLCDWENDKEILLKWIHINETSQNQSGRLLPKQGDEDGYAWLDYKNDWDYWRGGKAKIVSPKITDPVCMKFFFYLHGVEAGLLKIETHHMGTKKRKTVFNHYGDHGPHWQLGQLYINMTGEYQVFIIGTVGDHTARNAPGIDDILFSNDSCAELPEGKFNCSMSQSNCRWKNKGRNEIITAYESALQRYVTKYIGVAILDNICLQSPSIDFSRGCFHFSYRAKGFPGKTRYLGRLFVFVQTLNDQQLPVWSEHIYTGGEWTDVEIEIDLSLNRYQFIVEGLGVDGDFFFRDFGFYPNDENCMSTVEKTFYITSPLSHPENISISDKAGYCEFYPTWYFKAKVVPTAQFFQPMFFYSRYNSLILQPTRDDKLNGYLLGYFYASNKDLYNSSQAMFFSRLTQSNYSFVTEMGPKPIGKARNVTFVEEFGSVKDESKCEHGWTELAGKCFKLFCERKCSWNKARRSCSEHEADLASFGNNTLHVATEYLERAKVRFGGVRTILIGLVRTGRNWTWLDGQGFNGTVISKTPKARLTWNNYLNHWVVEGAENDRSEYLCQKVRVNLAYLKVTNHSSVISQFTSNLAVDGEQLTCSLTLPNSQPSWWQVDLGRDINLYRIKIIPSTSQKEVLLLNVSLIRNENTSENTYERTTNLSKRATELLYEPPVIARYVKLQTEEHKVLQLCEVKTYGSDDVKDLRGISRSFWKEILNYVPFSGQADIYTYHTSAEFFQVSDSFFMSTFDRPEFGLCPFDIVDEYKETMEAYFMPQVSGNYSFISTGDEIVHATVSLTRETVSSPILHWNIRPTVQTTPVQYFDSCKFYFLKAVIKETEKNSFTLDIRLQNDSSLKPISVKDFFWILPGKLRVDFSFGNIGLKETIIGAPLNLIGVFNSRCLGLYCGYCPLAIFISFAGHFQCTLLSNQTEAKSGSVELRLKDWVSLPVTRGVIMGYQRNGNCSEIVKTVGLDFDSNTAVTVISRLSVRPVLLILCAFQEHSICNGSVTYNGWNRVKIAHSISDFGFQSVNNISSIFSFGWIKDSAITNLTGICISFQYKMSESSNTRLSLFTQTFDGSKQKIWSLLGSHGDNWNDAWKYIALEEKLMFIFEVSSTYPIETITIANIRITTEECSDSKINPYYAQPGYVCNSTVFRCDNGACIKSIQRCDGEPDCLDGSDEEDCDCLIDEFRCESSGKCISLNKVCDKEDDCTDGSDERICNLCSREEFYCPSGKCVSWSATCNGLWDCLDGSDEPDVCKKSLSGNTANKTCSLNQLGCIYELTNNSDCTYFEGNCHFDDGWCGWSNVLSNDSFDWSINQGMTPTKNTGPKVDHTTTSSAGRYIYLETSAPRVTADTARLLGGPFQGGQTYCFQFYYHMFGEDIGQLNVYNVFVNRTETLLWMKKGEIDDRWHKALITVEAEQDFKIIVEGVRGEGHLGDIALDDITMTKEICSDKDQDETMATCSFDYSCSWSGIETWKKTTHPNTASSFFQGSFVYTETPFSLTKIVGQYQTVPYQCLSFWLRHSTSCVNTSVYFTQVIGKQKWNMSIVDTKDAIEDWRLTEIPLQQTSEEYTISLNAFVTENSQEKCFVAIDEIYLSLESCMIIKEGTPVLARIGSKFYRGLKTANTDATIAVYFHDSSSHFYKMYAKDNINQVVVDVEANISKIILGARVIVETAVDYALLGTVIGELFNKTNVGRILNSKFYFTVRLDRNGKNISASTQDMWLLPFQLEDEGPFQINNIMDCKFENYSSDFCYELLKKANWFDAVDNCKQLGGNILSIDSASEQRFISTKYPNISSLWLRSYFGAGNGTVGLSQSNRSNDSYNNIEEEKLKGKPSDGLCLLLEKGNLTRKSCSNVSDVLCKVPGKQRRILCKERNIYCSNQDEVLSIHSAAVGQDYKQLFECFNFDFTQIQDPCDFPDQTKNSKMNCDGKTSCNLNDAFNLELCLSHWVYFDVTYTCIVNRTTDEDVTGQQAWCPTGYEYFKSSCYKFSKIKKTWQDARSSCEHDAESTLVTINNKEENSFLLAMVRSSSLLQFWIGLNDKRYDGIFEWLDQSKVGYKYNWTENESRDCVMSNEYGWINKDCDTKAEFVCEYKPSPGSCDFEHDWCSWKTHPSNQNEFGWTREYINKNKSSAEDLSCGRLTLYKNNSSLSSSSVLSPWMRSFPIGSHGVCLEFVYRLFGQETELIVALERAGTNQEVLWKVKNLERDAQWQHGRITLGLSLQFRVYFTGVVIENGSAINIDNIVFKSGLCEPLPSDAQEWDTYLSINSTGFLTSPYYPSLYLNNMKRRWQLKSTVGQRIHIKFLFLNLEHDAECELKDFIAIQDGDPSKKKLFYCGKTLPTEYTSQSNLLWIIFQTDSTNTRTGFKIQYNIIEANSDENSCYIADVPDCPTNCRCYRWPSNQTKISVVGKGLLQVPLQFPRYTSVIIFDKSSIYKITASDFTNSVELEYLNLNDNLIATIEGEAFRKLPSLKTIQLSRNMMRNFPRNLFRENSSLEILDLSGNRIQTLELRQFSSLSRLRSLGLRLNRLSSLEDGVFLGLQSLQFLYLDHNELSSIEDDVFKEVRNTLKVLFLQQNNLEMIKKKWLRGMTSLEILKFNDNELKSVDAGAFDDLHNLIELDLSNNRIHTIPASLFTPLSSLKLLKVDHFTLCCYAEKSLPQVSCTSLVNNGISSCDELLKNTVLKYSIWVLGVMAFAGNMAVVVWRIVKKDKNKVNSFLLTNLAVADFLMGVYMLIIAYKDTVWQGVYFKHDISWRASDLCIFAGIVSTISSQVSVFTLSVITFDRLICIVFPFKFHRMSMKKAVTIMISVWLFGAIIAVIPLFYNDYFYDFKQDVHFYGRSPVCLPFQLSTDKSAGWEYSAFVFLGLNGFSFLFIVTAYFFMYRTITKAGNAVRSTRMNQDSTIAKRMMFIILTDFFCWFPVIIISILSLTGHFYDPRKQVYAWIAVFVLPINSSINPILYTFSTPLGRNTASNKSTFKSSSEGKARTFKTSNEATSPSNTSTRVVKTNNDSTKSSASTIGYKPSVIHRHQMLNEAFKEDEELAVESSFIEPKAEVFVLKPLEVVQMSDDEQNVKASFLAFYETNNEVTLCLVQVYDPTHVTNWQDTKALLSSLANDQELNGHDNLISFLWSAKANEISIKEDKSENECTIPLESDDCLICYRYPSKETLEHFLVQSHEVNPTAEDVYLIARDLIQAIAFLWSKQVIHGAISPFNIIITRNSESPSVKAFLGGLSSAKFAKSSSDDNEENSGDDKECLAKLSNDIKLYGKVLETMLENYPESNELSEIVVSCSSEDADVRPTPPQLLEKIKTMDIRP